MATPIKQIKDSADVLHDIQGIEYIVGTQTASTNMWKGVSDSEELYAGKVINYRLPYAGSTNTNTHTGLTTNTTLELTLANGTTVVHPVYRNASTAITTHYPVNSIIRLVFDPTSVTLNGHTFAGSWKTADYDSNTNTYVAQSVTTTNSNLPLILKASTSTSTVTTTVRFNSKLTGNPSVGSIKLNTTSITPTASSAITLNLPSTGGTIALEGFVTDSITTAISGVTQFDYAVTSTLPATGEKGTIYLTPHTHGVDDIYDEYIYANNDWEKIGNTDVDLSDYATTTYVENAISAVSTNYQKAPLIGNTNNITPSQVAAALAEGKDVFIETTQNFLGFNETFLFKVTVYGKTVSNLVVGSGLFKYSGHIYALKLEGSTQTDTWSWDVTEVALASDIPTVPTDVSAFNNDAGYITSITSSDVTTALGYTPSKVSIIQGLTTGYTIGAITVDSVTTTLYGQTITTARSNVLHSILGAAPVGVGSDWSYAPYKNDKIKFSISNDEGRLYLEDSTGTKFSSLSYDGLVLANGSTYTGTIHSLYLSSDQTYHFPDKSGIIALTSDIPTITATTTSVATSVGSNGTATVLTGIKFTSSTTALTSVTASTTSIYPAANVTALTSVTRSTTSIYPAANITALTSVTSSTTSIYPAANITAVTSITKSTTTMYGTGAQENVCSSPTVSADGTLSWTLVTVANGTSATVVTDVTSSGKAVRDTAATVVNAITVPVGKSVRDSATTVVNAVTINSGTSVRGTAVTVATGSLTTGTATVGTAVGSNGTTTALTGVKVTGTTVVVSGITST